MTSHKHIPLFLISTLLCLAVLTNASISITENSSTSTPLGSQCTSPLTPRAGVSSFWIQNIEHNGTAPFNKNPSEYKVYRNVMDYGAKGDGVTDDTAAINSAISDGHRCGEGCGSSTDTPALVFFPQGTYLISSPIIMYYYTQVVGDAINLPTLVASSSFNGNYFLDSNPYDSNGNLWWTNQCNFYRQVRNFNIDMTKAPSSLNGVHWPVAQATSLTNLVFHMSTDSGTQQKGIDMEAGSGGFMSDLIFNGGKIAMSLGNQQFTSRNITINNAQTAVYFSWIWAWTFKTLNINNCQLGLDLSVGGTWNQGVGSVVVIDAVVTNTPVFVKTGTTSDSQPKTSGSLILDNIELSNVPTAVQSDNGKTILSGPGSGSNTVIQSWGQGQFYRGNTGPGSFTQGTLTAPSKPSILLDASTGKYFERPRPQYSEFDVSDFVSVKSMGAMGDGQTDDTNAIQQTLTQYAGCKIIFFPAGVYLITNTVLVPAGSRIVGEVWSVISATGNNFSDESNPIPAFKVGNVGDVGVAEISDLIFSTQGPVPGAILVQWNIQAAADQQGHTGMWDTHYRIGGALGTNLESECNAGRAVKSECNGALILLHLTQNSSAYLENVWGWTADHDLDPRGGGGQLSIYTARGILIESANGPVWLYGTAAEHNVMYQYNIANAQNVLLAMIQTETPYFQSAPKAPLPYTTNMTYNDPNFANCPATSSTCAMAWGLRVQSSNNVFVYGAGLYNFFNNYDQSCISSENCQNAMVDLMGDNTGLYIYNLNTKAANHMIDVNGTGYANQADNKNNFCATIAGTFVESAPENEFFTLEAKSFLAYY